MLEVSSQANIRYETHNFLSRHINQEAHYNKSLDNNKVANLIDKAYIDAQPAFQKIQREYPNVVSMLRFFNGISSVYLMPPFFNVYLKDEKSNINIKQQVYSYIKEGLAVRA